MSRLREEVLMAVSRRILIAAGVGLAVLVVAALGVML